MHGRFKPNPAGPITQDSYHLIEIWREGQRIGTYNARIADTGRQYKDAILPQGVVADQLKVMDAPPRADIEAGDEAWADRHARYRVVAVQEFLHNTQVILNSLQ
jgi:hypothetical protein